MFVSCLSFLTLFTWHRLCGGHTLSLHMNKELNVAICCEIMPDGMNLSGQCSKTLRLLSVGSAALWNWLTDPIPHSWNWIYTCLDDHWRQS